MSQIELLRELVKEVREIKDNLYELKQILRESLRATTKTETRTRTRADVIITHARSTETPSTPPPLPVRNRKSK